MREEEWRESFSFILSCSAIFVVFEGGNSVEMSGKVTDRLITEMKAS